MTVAVCTAEAIPKKLLAFLGGICEVATRKGLLLAEPKYNYYLMIEINSMYVLAFATRDIKGRYYAVSLLEILYSRANVIDYSHELVSNYVAYIRIKY